MVYCASGKVILEICCVIKHRKEENFATCTIKQKSSEILNQYENISFNKNQKLYYGNVKQTNHFCNKQQNYVQQCLFIYGN